jgi:hypothetical protein
MSRMIKMAEPIAFQIEIISSGCGTECCESVYNFIESELDEIETYQHKSKLLRDGPWFGSYIIILSALGSAASLGSILWKAYEKIIKSKSKSYSDGMYIGIYKPDGSAVEFWCGDPTKNQEIFIEEFTAEANECKMSKSCFEETKRATRFNKSKVWIRRK